MKVWFQQRLARFLTAAALTGLACAQAGATGTLSVVAPGYAGFSPQTYTSADLKTVDFTTKLLTNTTGVSQGTTSATGGGGWNPATTATTLPSGFASKFARVSSGTSGTSKTTINFTNGTDYVSFLWHLGTGDSDNTITFKLSNNTVKTLTNCPDNNTSCVGGYDPLNIFSAFFNLIFGVYGQVNETQSMRVIYQPPTGVRVTAIELTASRSRVCALFVFCSWENRNLSIDDLSYNDNSNGTPLQVLDHVEVVSDTASGLTCEGNKFRVRACANADCSTPYTAGAVTGTVTFNRTGTLASSSTSANYSIPAGAAVSSTFTVNTSSYFGLSTSWNVSATASPTAVASHKCAFGSTTGSSSCTFVANTTGLKLGLVPHRSGVGTALNVALVKDVLGSCSTGLSGLGNLLINVTASFANAAGNTIVPSLLTPLGSRDLPNGSLVTGLLTSIVSGAGSNTFTFNDVGQVKLKVDVAGLSGLTSLIGSVVGLSNSVVTTVAPNGFKIEPVIDGTVVTSNPVVAAGKPIQLKISALNAGGGVAKNFGTEIGLGTIGLTKTVTKPTGAALKNNPDLSLGSIAISGGAATVSLSWDEVGTLDLNATLGNYLGSGMDVVGQLTSVVGSGLRFVPAKMGLSATPRCTGTDGSGTKAFAYAGQPIDVLVQALTEGGTVTQNYDGSAANAADRLARQVTVGSVASLTGGALSGNTLAATNFVEGVASGTVSYAMTNKLTAPETLTLKATDPDVTTNKTTPAVLVRSGRIKLSNAFGSESAPLEIPVQVQYWSGKSWVPSNDSCTTTSVINTNLVNRNAYKAHGGGNASGWSTTPSTLTLTGGVGKIVLSPPGKAKTGTVDIELDLSSAAPWLRSLDESCGANTVCNPRARATFGVYSPESKKTVNVSNVF